MTQDDDGVLNYLFEVGLLKRAKRTGWWITGETNPESIADHSFRTSLIGAVLATMEGADPGRVALLCVFHDTQETRVGDIPYVGRRYLRASSNEAVTADQVADFPTEPGAAIRAIVDEYENGDSIEALVAHDADKLECLLQAVEYREQGNRNVQPFIDNMLAALKTASAQRLGEAALTATSQQWMTAHLGRDDR